MDGFQWDTTEGTGYLKAGFLGFPKSGKTYTATLLAIATRQLFDLKSPIAFYDTETGSSYVRDLIQRYTGAEPLVKRSRSFDELVAFGKAALEANAIAIVDSITHPWRELCDSYLVQKNAARATVNKPPVKRLEFQDWNVLKPTWGVWTDFYLSSPMHALIAGRAGWEYEMELNEETNKKELVKTGVKMKTESEFGFEPSLLVEMEREQDRTGDVPRIVRRATVLGDRFRIIDGKSFIFEGTGDSEKDLAVVRAAFEPHLKMLTPGARSPIDTRAKTEFSMDESGDSEMYRERRERTILAEEIQGEIVSAYPGQSAADKKAKADLLLQIFGTRSWTQVEALNAKELRAGLLKLREITLARLQSKAEAEPAAAEA